MGNDMKSSTSRTVSIKSDEQYKTNLTLYAHLIHRSVADIVRESVDVVHGSAMKEKLESYFASITPHEKQSQPKGSNHA